MEVLHSNETEIPKVYKISYQVSKAGPVKINRVVTESNNEAAIDLRIMKQTLALVKRSHY